MVKAMLRCRADQTNRLYAWVAAVCIEGTNIGNTRPSAVGSLLARCALKLVVVIVW